jgi:hypothetical protein
VLVGGQVSSCTEIHVFVDARIATPLVFGVYRYHTSFCAVSLGAVTHDGSGPSAFASASFHVVVPALIVEAVPQVSFGGGASSVNVMFAVPRRTAELAEELIAKVAARTI